MGLLSLLKNASHSESIIRAKKNFEFELALQTSSSPILLVLAPGQVLVLLLFT